MLVYILTFILLLIGLYAVSAKKNLIKIIIGLLTMEYAINLFIILLGYRRGGIPPIFSRGQDLAQFTATAVDPIPQALVLTAIVISLGVLALMTALAIRLYEKYGTFDISEIKRLRG